MIAQATTVVDVYRDLTPGSEPVDVTYDEWGNEIETPRPDTAADPDTDPDPLLRGVPASIIERQRRFPDPTSGSLVTVSFHVGRVGSEVDVRQGDRLFDRGDARWYRVADVSRPQNPVVRLDQRLELAKVG